MDNYLFQQPITHSADKNYRADKQLEIDTGGEKYLRRNILLSEFRDRIPEALQNTFLIASEKPYKMCHLPAYICLFVKLYKQEII